MSLKQMLEELQQLPPTTQVTLVVSVVVLALLLAYIPTTGTTIIAFLIALKSLTTR